MNLQSLKDAISEAERFLKRARDLEKADRKIRTSGTSKNQFNPNWVLTLNAKDQAAARRSSMDLTRALARLRRGRYET